MLRLACPFLRGEVECSDERERHIAERHPELFPEHRSRIEITLADPDQIRRSRHFADALLFSRWYDDVRGGKYVVVVVVTAAAQVRHWIVTAYLARALAAGEIEWQRS